MTPKLCTTCGREWDKAPFCSNGFHVSTVAQAKALLSAKVRAIPPPGRRLTFGEAKDRCFKQYAVALRALAD